MQSTRPNRIGRGVVLAGLLSLTEPALANIAASGGSRILGTNFIIELVTVMTSVWVPAILIGTLIAVVGGVSFGYLRMGPGMSKLIFAVLIGARALAACSRCWGWIPPCP